LAGDLSLGIVGHLWLAVQAALLPGGSNFKLKYHNTKSIHTLNGNIYNSIKALNKTPGSPPRAFLLGPRTPCESLKRTRIFSTDDPSPPSSLISGCNTYFIQAESEQFSILKSNSQMWRV